MLKKSIITLLAVTILSLFCINISYAENNSMMQNLGNTITNSIDKTESTIDNGMHKMGNEISNTTNDVKNSFSNMTNNIENTFDNNNRNENYTAYRTSADEINATAGTMSSTAWTWLIISLVAIIIIAAIWYYAVVSTDKR